MCWSRPGCDLLSSARGISHRSTTGFRSMRLFVMVLAPCVLAACSNEPSNLHRLTLAPPTLQVSGASQVVSSASGPALQVSAALRNATHTHIQLAIGAQCPLFVRLFPDSSGAPMDSLDPSMACPPGSPTRDLAPGDTAILIRVLSGDSLTTVAPGLYGVNIAVTTSTAVLGTWAGAVRLPLVVP